jgi:hypothetical protein
MTGFEREDMELNEMFHGEEKPMHPETIHITLGGTEKPTAKPVSTKQSNPGKECPGKEKPVESLWEPEKPAPNWMDKLKQTTKDVCLYAVLSSVLFYWQQTGRLEETTSWYALLVCVGMVFFSVGKNCRGGVK